MSPLLDAGLGGVERLFGIRFTIAVLLPLLVAGGASALVGAAATGRTADDVIKAWQNYSASGQILLGFWAAVALIAAAYLLTFFQTSLLRLIEGYWPQRMGLGWLRRRRIARHRQLAEAGWAKVRTLHDHNRHIESSALATRLNVEYPPLARLAEGCLPTKVGNRLRAAEYYPLERYGIDSVIIWMRLLPLLPADATKRVALARTALDSAACILALAVAFGILWPVVLLVVGGPGSLAALCLLAWPVAGAAYTAAARATVSYGQEVRVAFDLHRSLLLQHLGWDAPPDLSEERRLWKDLADFYQRNLPMDAPPRSRYVAE